MSSRARTWKIYWAIWGALGLYGVLMDKVMGASSSVLTKLLPLNLLQNLVWGLLGLVVLYLADRFPIEDFSKRQWKTWALHGGVSLLVTALGLVLIYAIAYLFLEPEYKAKWAAMFPAGLIRFFRLYFQMSLFIMWGVLGAYHVIRAHRRMRERDLEAAQLESRLTQAQNQALRMQLQPHFLFNTLNSISALIHSDGEAADQMLTGLADLLRMTLDAGSSQEIPLRQELAFIEGYLSIERVRFQDRLRVDFCVPPECMEAHVPPFLLQPLVENAIKHGVSDLARASMIEVRARRDGEWLEMGVKDDGKGFQHRQEGIGTSNTANRLRLLYKDQQEFTLISQIGNGTLARIRLPWRTGALGACAP